MSMPSQPKVVITGAGSGLGRALVLALAKKQARIVASDVDEGSVQETARAALEAGALSCVARRCDVGRLEDVEALGREADAALGEIDLLVNNAGVAVAGPIGQVPIEDWEWVLRVNLWGVIYGCHVFIPRFRRQGHGHVLNVASAAGLMSAPEMGPYNVSKAGVVSLSETLRAELSETGIGVTVVCPTFFRTNLGKTARFTDPQQSIVLEKLFKKSKVTAEHVSEAALEAVRTNRLYVVPMAEGLWMWRVKRAHPERFGALVRSLMARFASS